MDGTVHKGPDCSYLQSPSESRYFLSTRGDDPIVKIHQVKASSVLTSVFISILVGLAIDISRFRMA